MSVLPLAVGANRVLSIYHDVVSIFRERPQLRRYIFGNETLGDSVDPTARAVLDTVCELVAGLLEHAWVQLV